MALKQLQKLLTEGWPLLTDLLDDEDVDKLWKAKFRNIGSIQAASKETLSALPLAAGIVSV